MKKAPYFGAFLFTFSQKAPFKLCTVEVLVHL
jgi:hypothetical protein